jgi:hydroxyethylthiazole kinase-like uncharacterized protein yjeF
VRRLPDKEGLPYALYRAEQVQGFDRHAMEIEGVSGADLMERAGQALFDLARRCYPRARRWLVVSGLGNNGGDGYVVARLARQAGLAVELLQVGDAARVQADALLHLQKARSIGLMPQPWQGGTLPAADLLIDAVFGIGLAREISGAWRAVIEAINQHAAPVLSVDLPSGIHPDTGAVMGVAVAAEHTLSFIGLKQGLFTGSAPDYCGELHFSALAVPARIYAGALLSARRLDWHRLAIQLPRRRRTAHKGDCGHVLVIGGAPGFAGAARLAGEAALRSGAGLVSLATHPRHADGLCVQRPELMCHAIDSAAQLERLLAGVDVVVAGPGLGRTPWSRRVFDCIMGTALPMVLDADGLNMLADAPRRLRDAVITPHPGEAARLLQMPVQQIQQDRFAAVEALRQTFAPVAVLKGAGTLISADGANATGLCSRVNPGMASGGMGDVLSGIIGALIAQGLALPRAAELGVVLHAEAAAQAVARCGELALLASDLIDELPALLQASA